MASKYRVKERVFTGERKFRIDPGGTSRPYILEEGTRTWIPEDWCEKVREVPEGARLVRVEAESAYEAPGFYARSNDSTHWYLIGHGGRPPMTTLELLQLPPGRVRFFAEA